MSKKITCPVCFTKMQPLGKDLVCPVCGYKYCAEHIPYTYDDHDHSNYRTYNTKTTYNAGSRNPSAGNTAPATGNVNPSRGGKQPPRPFAKIVTIIVVFYLIGIILSAIITFANSFFLW